MDTVTLRKQGNVIGVNFPAETCIRMGFEAGQELTLVKLADGVKLVKRNLKLERQMHLARDVLRADRRLAGTRQAVTEPEFLDKDQPQAATQSSARKPSTRVNSPKLLVTMTRPLLRA